MHLTTMVKTDNYYFKTSNNNIKFVLVLHLILMILEIVINHVNHESLSSNHL